MSNFFEDEEEPPFLIANPPDDENINLGDIDKRDILSVGEDEIPDGDILTAGFPCQPFSNAGNRKGVHDSRGMLYKECLRIIQKKMPKVIVFENVKGLYRTTKHREFFEHLKSQLLASGYFITEQLINSIEFGAPQDRDRIILIGFHNRLSDQLHITENNGIISNFDWDKNKKYSRDVLNLDWPTTSPYVENSDTPAPKEIIPELTVKYWWDKNDVVHHPNENMYFKPKAGLYRFQSKDEGDNEKKCYKRLHRWRYSPTAAYGNNEVHIHPFLPRRISVAEALAIQSLPASFVIPEDITLTDAFKTIGNGVPYLAAKGIALNIYDYIHNH